MRRLTRLLDRHAERSLERETRGVTKATVVGSLVALAVVLAALPISQRLDGPLGILATLVVAVSAGAGVTMGLARRIAYRRGWLDGRIAFLRAMREAAIREMPFDEFLLAEAERDGIEIEIRPES